MFNKFFLFAIFGFSFTVIASDVCFFEQVLHKKSMPRQFFFYGVTLGVACISYKYISTIKVAEGDFRLKNGVLLFSDINFLSENQYLIFENIKLITPELLKRNIIQMNHAPFFDVILSLLQGYGVALLFNTVFDSMIGSFKYFLNKKF